MIPGSVSTARYATTMLRNSYLGFLTYPRLCFLFITQTRVPGPSDAELVSVLALAVRRVDNAIHWINHYPADTC